MDGHWKVSDGLKKFSDGLGKVLEGLISSVLVDLKVDEIHLLVLIWIRIGYLTVDVPVTWSLVHLVTWSLGHSVTQSLPSQA